MLLDPSPGRIVEMRAVYQTPGMAGVMVVGISIVGGAGLVLHIGQGIITVANAVAVAVRLQRFQQNPPQATNRM